MGRIEELHKKINALASVPNEVPLKYSHLIEVSQACALLAVKRGENAELASMAGLLHDIADFKIFNKNVTAENHAALSADIAMKILTELGLTSEEENAAICEAVKKHTDKNTTDTALDEILKDADVFAHGIKDIALKNFRGYRWDKVCAELGISNCRN